MNNEINDSVIGIITSLIFILFLEVFKQFDKKLIATLTLVGIAFIYIGFVWTNSTALIIVSISVLIFSLLSYYGYQQNFRLIILGLISHGIWDLLYPYFNTLIPKGYDIFCLTVDWILAIYFYFRLKKQNVLEITIR
jgi:hypothetical protein